MRKNKITLRYDRKLYTHHHLIIFLIFNYFLTPHHHHHYSSPPLPSPSSHTNSYLHKTTAQPHYSPVTRDWDPTTSTWYMSRQPTHHIRSSTGFVEYLDRFCHLDKYWGGTFVRWRWRWGACWGIIKGRWGRVGSSRLTRGCWGRLRWWLATGAGCSSVMWPWCLSLITFGFVVSLWGDGVGRGCSLVWGYFD